MRCIQCDRSPADTLPFLSVRRAGIRLHDGEIHDRQRSRASARSSANGTPRPMTARQSNASKMIRPVRVGVWRVKRIRCPEPSAQGQHFRELFPEALFRIVHPGPERFDSAAAAKLNLHMRVDNPEHCRGVLARHCILQQTAKLREIRPAGPVVARFEVKAMWLAPTGCLRRIIPAGRHLTLGLFCVERGRERSHCAHDQHNAACGWWHMRVFRKKPCLALGPINHEIAESGERFRERLLASPQNTGARGPRPPDQMRRPARSRRRFAERARR